MSISNSKPTVILADDHGAMLVRTQQILADEFRILATASDGLQAVRAAVKSPPDILVLDIGMPGLDGIQVGREIRRLGFDCKIVFLTVQEDDDYVDAARSLNASYVLKPRMHTDLLTAIEETLAGRIFVSPFSAVESTRPA